MFSTLDGAKRRAKELKRQQENCGFDFPLNRAQDVIAKAGGFRDWHDLESSIGLASGGAANDPAAYARRLLKALPDPRRPPAIALLDGEVSISAGAGGVPSLWWTHVFPYMFAIAVIHRSQTALLRPGSGSGQKLRENLVVGLLLNLHGGDAPLPRMDPDTLTLIYKGDPRAIFRADADHSDFARELQRLIEAGIIVLRPNQVRIAAPDAEAVRSHVLSGWIGKIEQSAEDGGKIAIDALRDALAAIGIRDALRVAGAILEFGSDAYDRPHGAGHELLSRLAEEGAIDTFAKATHVLSAARPQSVDAIRNSVPAKISSLYLARYLGLQAGTMRYTISNADWADRLKRSLSDPTLFVQTVDRMAEEIAAIR